MQTAALYNSRLYFKLRCATNHFHFAVSGYSWSMLGRHNVACRVTGRNGRPNSFPRGCNGTRYMNYHQLSASTRSGTCNGRHGGCGLIKVRARRPIYRHWQPAQGRLHQRKGIVASHMSQNSSYQYHGLMPIMCCNASVLPTTGLLISYCSATIQHVQSPLVVRISLLHHKRLVV